MDYKLKELLEEYNITNYFVFDGLGYLKQNMKAFTRESEYEKVPSFYDEACGIWLDEFQDN